MTDGRGATLRTGVEADPLAGLARVRDLVAEQAKQVVTAVGAPEHVGHLLPGKLLRSRFGLYAAAGGGGDPEVLAKACAAIEMVHTASLCHDDVIDNALLRRSLPTLWRKATPSAAVLIGDVLLCHAAALVASAAGARYLVPFLAKVTEVCTTEARQELILRGRRVSQEACLEVARGKTGPLFAFLGLVAGAGDAALAAALTEAGYRLGTAYQLADDLLDVDGRTDEAGKTLGTDRNRGKFTLPLSHERGREVTTECVRGLLLEALAGLAAWPRVGNSVQAYIEQELVPVMGPQAGRLGLRVEAPGRA